MVRDAPLQVYLTAPCNGSVIPAIWVVCTIGGDNKTDGRRCLLHLTRQRCIPVKLEESERGAWCCGCLINVTLDNVPGFRKVGQEYGGIGDSLGEGNANDAAASS